jgi:hypothetical protein
MILKTMRAQAMAWPKIRENEKMRLAMDCIFILRIMTKYNQIVPIDRVSKNGINPQ